MKFTRYLLVPSLLGVVLFFAACSREPEVPSDSLLRYVPADTPYLFVADRQLPDGLRQRLADQYAAQMAAQSAGFARLREQIEAAPEAGEIAARGERFLDVLQAFFAELEGRDTAASLRELGIEPATRSVLYGIGLLPAMRVEIVDAGALNAFLDRIEQRAGVSAQQGEHQGQKYRRIDLGEVDAVLAVSEQYAIAGLLADSLFERYLPLLLGQRLPERDLAASGEVAAMIERHRFTGFGEGFIKLDALVATLLGRAAGRSGETMRALGGQAVPISTACMGLVDGLVGGMPRMTVGVTRADDQQLATRAVWESTPAVADYLGRLAAPVPGVGGDYDGLIAIGLGVDLPQLRNAIQALLGRVADLGAECEWVDPAVLQAVMPQLNLALGPMTAGIRGFNLHLDDLRLDPATMEPRDIQGGLLAAVDDPRGVFALGAMFNPALATLQLPMDGSLVELPRDVLAEPNAPPLRVAMKDKALVVLAGEEPATTLGSLMDAAVVTPSPLFAVDYGVHELVERFGALLDGAARQLVEQGEMEMAAELREQVSAFRLQAQVFDRLRVSMYANEEGLVVDQVMELR